MALRAGIAPFITFRFWPTHKLDLAAPMIPATKSSTGFLLYFMPGYRNRLSLGLWVMPGIRPLFATGLPSISFMSIVISIGLAAEM